MTPYQILIEGVFVTGPGLERQPGGFHATFHMRAINAANAAHRARDLLLDRMTHHGVCAGGAGLLKTYCWVHDLWEVTEERLLAYEGRDTGFTFFRIGAFERIGLALRGEFSRRRRPWLLVDVRAGQAGHGAGAGVVDRR